MAFDLAPSGSPPLSVKVKLGYAVGQLTDSLGYNLFYIFFLYFLTDFAGVPAGIAGTIILVAVLWDAISDPLVGQFSDRLQSRWGRRRPLMAGALIPYALCVFLLYVNPPLGPEAKPFYYGAVAVLFWSSYKTFVIPFFALGAEVTDDFNERTALRVWAGFFLYLAVMCASSLPPFIVDMTHYFGGDGLEGWRNVGLVFALLTFATGLVCWSSTRGREAPAQKPSADDSDFFSSFKSSVGDLLRLKCVRRLAGSVFFWSATCAITSGGAIYLMTTIMEFSADLQSLCFIFYSAVALAFMPAINWAAARFDKKTVYCISMGFSGVGVSLFYFSGFTDITVLLAFFFILQIGNSVFWTIYYSMMYDISELDEFKSGQQREGSITAIMSFCQKVGAAIAVWLTGVALEIGGYDGTASIQTDAAKDTIIALNTWMPGLLGVIAAGFALAYPLTRSRFAALSAALDAKRAGQPYSEEGFKEIL